MRRRRGRDGWRWTEIERGFCVPNDGGAMELRAGAQFCHVLDCFCCPRGVVVMFAAVELPTHRSDVSRVICGEMLRPRGRSVC